MHAFGLICIIAGVLWGSIVPIWEPFGSHVCDFLGIRWIFEKVCFTIVKPFFLRSGRVLVRYFSVLCVWIDTLGAFVVDILGVVGP